MNPLIELLIVVAPSAIVLVAFGVGAWISRSRANTSPSAICACTHSLGEHEPPVGKCCAEVRRNQPAGYRQDTWVPCACMRYIGPRPVEDLFTMPTLPPTNPT